MVIITSVSGSLGTAPADNTKCMNWLTGTVNVAEANDWDEFSVPDALRGKTIGADR